VVLHDPRFELIDTLDTLTVLQRRRPDPSDVLARP
jgi:hypothetical protein